MEWRLARRSTFSSAALEMNCVMFSVFMWDVTIFTRRSVREWMRIGATGIGLVSLLRLAGLFRGFIVRCLVVVK